MSAAKPAGVAEPFASDSEFWTAVRSSADALVTLLVAALVTALVGGWWTLLFVVPILFLARAASAGSVSARRSRSAFGSREEWRDAERQAVATAFVPVLLRRRRRDDATERSVGG